jgi:hypothetical protein
MPLIEDTEIRNRIYELAIADSKHERGCGRIRLKYRSIKGLKRFKTAKRWTAAHQQRHYWGLVQVCQALRQEFRPLYRRTLRLSISAQHVGQWLCAFSRSDTTRAFGLSLKDVIGQPLPDGGLDILPLLRKLSKKKKYFPVLYNRFLKRSRLWDVVSLVATFFYQWVRSPQGLEHIVHKITAVILAMDNVHDGGKQLSVIIQLRHNTFSRFTQELKEKVMVEIVRGSGLGRYRNLLMEIRCGEWSYVWGMPSGISWRTTLPLLISEKQHEDQP